MEIDKATVEIIRQEIRDWCNAEFKERVELLIQWKVEQLEKEFDQRVLIAIAKKFFAPTEINVSVETRGIKTGE